MSTIELKYIDLVNPLSKGFICLFMVFCGLNIQAQPERIDVVELEFSTKGGFFDEEIQLELFCPGGKIYYTKDGTKPSRYASRYRGPINIKKTTPIRAIAYKGGDKSDIVGHTYFIEEPKSTFPIISIQITPELLFDEEYGLFMDGYEVVDSIWSKPGANFWSRRELGVNTEIFEDNGECVFRSPTGFRLFGGMSRLFPQKSMVLVSRNDYGEKRFKHKIFGKKNLKKYKFLTLRNSGSDFGKAQFRDAFMTSLVDDWDLEKQNARPSHVYINGKYWGIYNIREKINRYFLASHCEVDKDSVDIMEHRTNRKRGSTRDYRKMIKFIERKDLAVQANYDALDTMMEISNFMDYQIAQIFFDNQDAGGNIKYWKPSGPGGRWRWILYDTDWGFGLHDSKAYNNKSLAFHTEKNGRAWPNPPWSTLILRNLLENHGFKAAFINRFADHLNDNFESDNVLSVLAGFRETYEPEMPRHFERWNLREKNWEEELTVMREFGKKRPDYVRKELQMMLNAGEQVSLDLDIQGGGTIKVNDHLEVLAHKTCTYFNNVPITLEAVPHFGYRFSHWEGVNVSDSIEVFELKFDKTAYNIKAVFKEYINPMAGKILINEISCNNKRTGDWLELYNNSEEAVDLEGWILTDLKNEFRLPPYKLAPKSYVNITEKEKKFRKHHVDPYGIIGDFGFGLSKRKESIQLYTSKGDLVDSVGYLLEPTDSIFSYTLLLPELDNADEENWEILPGIGSPGTGNPYFIESRIKAQQDKWIKVGASTAFAIILMFLLGWRNWNRRRV